KGAVGSFGEGKEFVDFCLQEELDLQETFVANRFTLGSVGMDLAAVDADVSQLQQSHRLCQEEDLHEQILELRKELFAEGGDSVMVWRVIARKVAEGGSFPGGLLDLSCGENAGGIGIDKQSDHHLGGIGCASPTAIVIVDRF